jgi:hypothetical protein
MAQYAVQFLGQPECQPEQPDKEYRAEASSDGFKYEQDIPVKAQKQDRAGQMVGRPAGLLFINGREPFKYL